MIDFPTFLLFATIIFLGAFILGWNLSVKKWRVARTALKIRVDDLNEQIAVFHVQLDADPERGWTDTGIMHSVSQMESTLSELTRNVEDRRKRTS